MRGSWRICVLPFVLAAACTGAKQSPPDAGPVQQVVCPPAVPEFPEGATPQYLSELAAVHRRHQSPDRALRLLDAALEKETDGAKKAQLQLQRADTLIAAGKLDDADVAYARAAEGIDDPAERAPLDLQLGSRRRQAKRLDEALPLIERAFANAKQPWIREQARSELLEAWRDKGMLEAKITELEGKEAPDQETRRLLADAYGRAGKAAQAMEIYRKLAAASPSNANLWQQLGQYAAQAGRHKEAIDAYVSYAAITPDARPHAYERIATMYLESKQPAKAQEWINKLAALASPSQPHLYLQLAQLNAQLGKHDKALAAYRAGLEAMPPQGRDGVRLQLAAYLLQGNQLDAAYSLYEEVAAGDGPEEIRRMAKEQLQRLPARKAPGPDAGAVGP